MRLALAAVLFALVLGFGPVRCPSSGAGGAGHVATCHLVHRVDSGAGSSSGVWRR